MAIFQRTLTATAAAATVFAALAMPVWAQTPAAPAAATTTAVEPAARAPGHHPRDHATHEKRMADKAQKFQTALQLTPAQQAGWNSYREAVKPAPHAKRMDREGFAQLTTPQRIDHMQEKRAERNAHADRRAQATKAFYATLTPTQQKTFDAETLRFGKHHGKRHGPHGKHHAPGHGKAPVAAPSAR